jgi:hypothetical protein
MGDGIHLGCQPFRHGARGESLGLEGGRIGVEASLQFQGGFDTALRRGVGIEPPEPAEVSGDGFDDAATFAG